MEELEEKQQKILIALLSCFSIREAAQKLGIAENTVYLALRDPKFAKAYREALRQQIEMTMNNVAKLGNKALSTLNEMLSPEKSDRIRLDAAKTVLEFMLKGYEVTAIQERIALLEELVAKKSQEEEEELEYA